MSSRGSGTSATLCALTLATILLTSCAEDELASVSSFRYTETTTGQLDGESLDSREVGYYRAPDSARVIGNAAYSPLGLQEIVIGPQVWRRDASGWLAGTTDSICYTVLDKINWILRHGGQHEDANETLDGPTMGGEPTRRYKWAYDDAGRGFISASELTLGDSPSEIEALASTKEVFSDLAWTKELAVGNNTGRIYSLINTLDGAKLSQRVETVVDQYDQPVEVKPPPNVAPADPNQRASPPCPESPGDFPWILAAIAAVLGPLLFLGASSFVWPRRL